VGLLVLSVDIKGLVSYYNSARIPVKDELKQFPVKCKLASCLPGASKKQSFWILFCLNADRLEVLGLSTCAYFLGRMCSVSIAIIGQNHA
jgi:hypothetical protein